MNILKIAFLLIPLILSSLSCLGQSTGFDMLTIGPNTEALGVNEATTAMLLGASDIYVNPANLVLEPSSNLRADYALWIAGLNYTHLATNFKKQNRALAFGVLASEADDFELRSRPGPSEGSFSISYLSLSAAYALKIKNISAGISGHYLREEIYLYNASGYAMNAGISSHWLGRKLFISAAVQNLGKMDVLNVEETTLPTQFRTGFSADLFTLSTGHNEGFPIAVRLASDFVLPLQKSSGTTSAEFSNDAFLNVGLSLKAAELITLRSGYKSGNTERPLSFGLGLSLNHIKADYALIPFKTGFGTVHSIGLSYEF